MNRRDFLRAAAGVVAGSASLARAQPAGAGKYRTALIGTGWWGMNILNEAIAAGESQVVGLCDVDQRQLDSALQRMVEDTGEQPKVYKDYRELLEKERPQIAIVATPDHWHALPTIAAVQAGAHVYVEKPVGHTIGEGRAMVQAARDAGRIVQVGTHRRVSPHNVAAMKFLKEGKAGDIGMVRCFVHGGGGRERPRPNSDVPEGLDWDMWCGPAPVRPFNTRIHPRGFRHFLDYANGQLGDWGIHWLDHVLWLTEEKAPKRVFGTGGRPIAGEPVNDGKEQTSDAPDSMVVTYEFESFTCTWEHRRFGGNNAEKHGIGAYFYGTRGIVHIGWRDGWSFYPMRSRDAEIHEEPQLNEPDHQNIKELWADFLGSIKSGKPPVCDIEIGHRSTNMSLLGMLSWKLGRSVEWDGDTERVVGDDDANKLLTREYRGEWEYPIV
ncbi:MAG: Gfo/Idh/MocA family oxidoreductase [Armatimonadota bacterium]